MRTAFVTKLFVLSFLHYDSEAMLISKNHLTFNSAKPVRIRASQINQMLPVQPEYEQQEREEQDTAHHSLWVRFCQVQVQPKSLEIKRSTFLLTPPLHILVSF